jgi:transposase
MAKKSAPEIITLTTAQLEELLARLAAALPAELYRPVEKLLRTLQWMMQALEAKDTSLGRLARLLFGPKTEKTKQVFPTQASPATPSGDSPGAQAQSAPAKPKRKGHGRIPASAYTGAKLVKISHPTLHEGDRCPKCHRGKLRLFKRPAEIVRITAQSMLAATRYQLEKLRCALCGEIFTAPAPPDALQPKCDPEVGVMLGYARFGNGLPHYRMERMQAEQGVPLPASTQWELMAKAGEALEPVHEALSVLAANGTLLHNDDTVMRVQSLAKEANALAQAEPGPGGLDAPAKKAKERTGIFTTGIVAEAQGHSIALFFTGHHHAGENLDQLLARRQPGAPPPIQMCDALSRNLSKSFHTILANCLAHGRREFVDIAPDFPAQCQRALEDLGRVYQHDDQTKERGLSPEARLRFHQQHSQPIMEGLHQWMKEQLDQKQVEPNSGLGKAFQYLINHWKPLTLFLRQAGAPLDNTICERALKMAILHRKNSLGYKTQNGARLGDLFMSLIHTCRLCGANALHYLNTLQHHAKEAREQPAKWLPWNYQAALPPPSAA